MRCAAPPCENEVEGKKYCGAPCRKRAWGAKRRGNLTVVPAVATVLEPEEGRLEFLRQTNQRLQRENARLKLSRSEVALMVSAAVKDAMADLKIPALVKRPILDRRRKSGEYAAAVLSDWQVGKKTLDYNVAVAEQRIELYGDKLLRIAELQRADHPVRHVRVWLLGDMVEGEDIFAGQTHHLDKSLYYQVAVDCPRIIVNFLRRMLENFETVHVVGIAGNHGRLGGSPKTNQLSPSTNADRMVYSIVQGILAKEDRITWDIPNGELEGDFYALDRVGQSTFLLIHGHQISGLSGVPYAGIEKRVKGWAMGAIKDKFDYVLMGHFHCPTRTTINTVTAFVNGTTESSNGFALEKMAAIGRPCQYLLFVHPEHGISGEYCLYLDHA